MYCTGGVRCERASSLLKHELGDDVGGVFQLQGGIDKPAGALATHARARTHVHTHTHTCVHPQTTHARRHTYTHTNTRTHTHTDTQTHTHAACKHTCTHARTQARRHARTLEWTKRAHGFEAVRSAARAPWQVPQGVLGWGYWQVGY
jgi:predicted sulfurtransferase